MPAPTNMDMPGIPRVTAQQLRSMTNQLVRFVGEVVQVSDGFAKLNTPNGQVMVRVNTASAYTRYVEVQGHVINENTIEEQSYTNFGDDFDLKTYTLAVELAAMHPDIF